MTDPAAEPRVITETLDHILVIRMARADKRNAIDGAMTAALDTALNRFEDDDNAWVGVLASTSPAFCAGTDLSCGAGPPTNRGGEYGVVRRRRVKPLIVAVEGFALGGGFEMVLAADLVTASINASFGLPEVSRGLIATCGALFRAPRALPLNVARELVLTGEPLNADRAHALGLVNVLTEPGAALDAAMRLARRICANAPSSVRASLQALDTGVSHDDGEGWHATASALASIAGTADFREGRKAFLEKRSPEWTGR